MSNNYITFMVEIVNNKEKYNEDRVLLRRKWIRVGKDTIFSELFEALCQEVNTKYGLVCVDVKVGCKHGASDPSHFVDADLDYPVNIVSQQEANFVQFTAENTTKNVLSRLQNPLPSFPFVIELPEKTKSLRHRIGPLLPQLSAVFTLVTAVMMSSWWYVMSLCMTLSMRFIIVPALTIISNRWNGAKLTLRHYLSNVFLFVYNTCGSKLFKMTSLVPMPFVKNRGIHYMTLFMPTSYQQVKKIFELM